VPSSSEGVLGRVCCEEGLNRNGGSPDCSISREINVCSSRFDNFDG
jgi:hypothetical protein